MTDRELLELASKAAGIEYTNKQNPLVSDELALRLAVKLNLGISIPIHGTIKADVICFQNSAINIREEGNNPYAATRRAIVRAAAEIGKDLK